MQLRYRSILPLVAVCLALAIAPAFAAKPTPAPMATPEGAPGVHPIGEVSALPPVCTLGVLSPPASAFGYILPPDDVYYTLLNTANCPSCGAVGYRATTAHVLLFFTEPCNIPVTVSLAPAFDDDGDGCFTPNPFAPPLCPPIQYVINDGGVLNSCVDYQLPLDPTCCFSGRAFVVFEFDQGSCVAGRPGFCSPGPGGCSNCTQYNYYPGAGFPGDDLCVVLSPFGFYGINMFADLECCGVVPTLPGSWGLLKTLYR